MSLADPQNEPVPEPRFDAPGANGTGGRRPGAGSGSGSTTGPAVALVSLGCRVSRADLEGLAASLPVGASLALPGTRADVVVVGTCTITADADSASRQAIRRAAREHPGARIVAAGCYAERCPGALRGLPGVAAVVGARSQRGLPAIVAALAAGRAAGTTSPEEGPAWDGASDGARLEPVESRHARPALKVQDGCDERCSYCAVPLARGPARSMPFEAAVARASALRARHAELVLTGVHLGDYGRDLRPARSLRELIDALVVRPGGRVRLSSVEPLELPLGLFADAGTRDLLCPHLHLPLQSGAARVLRAMGRPYGPEEYAAVVDEIAARVPGACLGADVLAGFPGETEADHRDTVALVERLPLAYLHVFPFSPRPGTPAAALPAAVPAAVRRARAEELRAISARRWKAFLRRLVGRTLDVVAERVADGEARGTSGEFAPVRWSGGPVRRGDLARVHITSSDEHGCSGVIA
jgi:threonylcarbamoyladenosine tRNA methylthiotransferase MtaB